ncbi:MAG: molybdenum cofactor biosynthesis protein MoaE [Dermatophilaceae bacterium]
MNTIRRGKVPADLSRGDRMPSEADPTLLVAVRDLPLSVDEVLDAVRHPSCGGIALFVGTVRDHDHDTSVEALDYSAHPTAEAAMATVCRDVLAGSAAVRVAAVHRTGALSIGDVAVVVAAAAPHRAAAFDACRDLIETLKAQTPIWKRQHLGDGSAEWLGL